MARFHVQNEEYWDDVLHVIETAPPDPEPGQVRVAVKAAGVQPFDALFRSGAAHAWVPATFPQRLGNEFAGVVEGTGAEVLGWAMLGSYAEHVVVGADDVVPKPAGMPWEEAGVLSASGQTAASALTQLEVRKGETVVIHAAAGGVGSFAVQIARARGATVIGTGSKRNHEYLEALDAIPVEYGDGLAERIRTAARSTVDVALDASGTIEALEASVRTAGRVGTVAWQPAADKLGVRRLSTERSAAQLRELTGLYAAGRLRIAIQQVYRLDEAAQAHRAIETGHVRGKLVLVP